MTLSALRCACGSTAVVAISPGTDATTPGNFEFAINREVPMRGWCLAHWGREDDTGPAHGAGWGR